MTKREAEARERIIEAASALIGERGGVESVTTRDIAARAGVGAGLVNYHFQTKERLLDLCTQRIIGRVIGRFDAIYRALDMDPTGKLRTLVKETARFLTANPGISRASILRDMLSPEAGDNTSQTFRAYLPVVREVCAGRAADAEERILLHALISSLQSAFLRGGTFMGDIGFDLFDKEQRDKLVDMLIDSIFGKYL